LAVITPEAMEARCLAAVKEFSQKPSVLGIEQFENTARADRMACHATFPRFGDPVAQLSAV